MAEPSNTNPFDDAPVIFSYSRKQAIEDGVLVDLTPWAKETGFRYPVACTRTVWEGCIVPPAKAREMGQCDRGRAHDLLWMLWCAIRRGGVGNEVLFEVIFTQANSRQRTVKLNSVCGPGDPPGCEPVITITLPDED